MRTSTLTNKILWTQTHYEQILQTAFLTIILFRDSKVPLMYFHYLLYYKVRCVYVCLFVCGHSDVRLTTPPVLMLWGTQGYLWLPYNLTEVIKLVGERFEPPKNIFFSKNILCHSFCIVVIPSGLLSLLPDFCYSFRILVIPFKYCHSFLIIATSNICHPEQLQYLPIPEERENWPAEPAIFASQL